MCQNVKYLGKLYLILCFYIRSLFTKICYNNVVISIDITLLRKTEKSNIHRSVAQSAAR